MPTLGPSSSLQPSSMLPTACPLLHERPYAIMLRLLRMLIHYWTTSYSASWSAAMQAMAATLFLQSVHSYSRWPRS